MMRRGDPHSCERAEQRILAPLDLEIDVSDVKMYEFGGCVATVATTGQVPPLLPSDRPSTRVRARCFPALPHSAFALDRITLSLSIWTLAASRVRLSDSELKRVTRSHHIPVLCAALALHGVRRQSFSDSLHASSGRRQGAGCKSYLQGPAGRIPSVRAGPVRCGPDIAAFCITVAAHYMPYHFIQLCVGASWSLRCASP